MWAFSGGGPHLTVALRKPLNYIRCLVAYYTILDLVDVPRDTDTPNLSTDFLERYSPAQYVNDTNNFIPPVFVVRAGQDVPFLNASIDKFVSGHSPTASTSMCAITQLEDTVSTYSMTTSVYARLSPAQSISCRPISLSDRIAYKLERRRTVHGRNTELFLQNGFLVRKQLSVKTGLL